MHVERLINIAFIGEVCTAAMGMTRYCWSAVTQFSETLTRWLSNEDRHEMPIHLRFTFGDMKYY